MDRLISPNGQYEMKIQDDGNLVVYRIRDGKVIWATVPDDEAGEEAPEPPVPPQPQPSPSPPPSGDFTSWPRRGLSYYASLTDPRLDPAAFFSRLRDAGANLTRTWLMDAWAVNQGGPGQYDGYVPFMLRANVWDLDRVDPRYLERLRAYTEAANDRGVLPQFTGLELYTWSSRKAGMLWVPDQSALWMQRNRQGLIYRDDEAFNTLATGGAHGWLGAFCQAVVDTLRGLHWVPELGNEMPEKPLHARLRGLWRAAGYTGRIAVNRQEDTPGQYANMRIGQAEGYDLLNLHGKKTLDYLDEVFMDEPTHHTFRHFFASGPDTSRITLSSDGCRDRSDDVEHTYDYTALGEVFTDALRRGCGIEHQSRLKMRSFLHGGIDLNDLEVEWFRSL